MRTRGSGANPPNRFEPIRSVPEPEESAELEGRHPDTRLLADPSRTIVATNASPWISIIGGWRLRATA